MNLRDLFRRPRQRKDVTRLFEERLDTLERAVAELRTTVALLHGTKSDA